MRSTRAFAVTVGCLIAGGAALAQVGRGGSEWLTAQGDAQRSGWIRSDAAISVDSLSKPGFELQWKSTLENAARRSNALSQGVTANGVTLFVPMSVVTGSANNVYALDNDTGYLVWRRHFDAAMPDATDACPGGVTAAATRIITLMPPAGATPRAGGAARGGAGYRSLLGQPGEGVPVEARGGPGRAAPPPAAPNRGAAPAAAPPAGGNGARGAAPGANAGIPGAPDGGGPASGYGKPSGVVYAIASDGMLHVLGLPSGKDIQRPAAFLPANARWSDPIAVETTLYTTTSGGCGGAPSGVWAINLDSADKPVVSWKTNGGDLVGRAAFTTTGTILVAVGPGAAAAGAYANAMVALDAKTLEVKDWFASPQTEFVTGPAVFRDGDRELAAAATKDGRVLLFDTAALGGADHATPLFASRDLLAPNASFAAGALTTWQQGDADGTRWLLASIAGQPASDLRPSTSNGAVTSGAVLAVKLAHANGAWSIEPAWTSHDLTTPAAPLVVNGVAFALSTGRAAAGASSPAVPAELFAYDAATGRSLWRSARAIGGLASDRSLWSAMGQVYVGAMDGTVYAFGFVDERR